MPSRPVRLAVAGLGRIGQLHARNLAGRTPGVELAAVVDPVARLARRIADALGATWSTSFDEVLSDPAVDGVVIAAPTAEHAAMVERAARAGKHVFCEKPIA